MEVCLYTLVFSVQMLIHFQQYQTISYQDIKVVSRKTEVNLSVLELNEFAPTLSLNVNILNEVPQYCLRRSEEPIKDSIKAKKENEEIINLNFK